MPALELCLSFPEHLNQARIISARYILVCDPAQTFLKPYEIFTAFVTSNTRFCQVKGKCVFRLRADSLDSEQNGRVY